MFESLTLHQTPIAPALFLAPMAGITTSAFRRLLADFGGYGALTTEMISASAFLNERPDACSFTKRRPEEGLVIYQFRVSTDDRLEAMVEKLAPLGAAALDLNLGCPAPKIQAQASGAALFREFDQLQDVLTRIRKVYDGILTVKVRLGDDPATWEGPFLDRLRLFEDCGVDALTVHPRFSFEKLKRRARWEQFPWIAERTRLPLIGNGDVLSPADVQKHAASFSVLSGLMLGRIVAIRPWIFREFAGLEPLSIDHAEVWDRLCRYTLEDMPPERALPRMQEFTSWYSQNFTFGHTLNTLAKGATDCDDLRAKILAWLGNDPQQVRTISVW